MNDGDSWHLRQLWQFAKNRGFSVKLGDGRIWLTPSEHGSAAPGRSFPDTQAGMQAARAWLSEPVAQVSAPPSTAVDAVGRRVTYGGAQVVGWIIGFVVVSAIFAGARSWWADNHYSSDYDNAFLSNCEAQPGTTASYCGCALDQVHERYSPKEATEAITSSDSPAVQQIASYCVGQ